MRWLTSPVASGGGQLPSEPPLPLLPPMALAPLAPAFAPLAPAFAPLAPAFAPLAPAFAPLAPAFAPLAPAFAPLAPAFASVAGAPAIAGAADVPADPVLGASSVWLPQASNTLAAKNTEPIDRSMSRDSITASRRFVRHSRACVIGQLGHAHVARDYRKTARIRRRAVAPESGPVGDREPSTLVRPESRIWSGIEPSVH